MRVRLAWVVVAVAMAALVAVGIWVPTRAFPDSRMTLDSARVQRVCPVVGTATQAGAAGSGGDLALASLADQAHRSDLPASGTFVVEKDPAVVSAPLGATFTASVSSSASSGAESGLSLTGCLQARSEHWFTGVRSNAGSSSELVLINLDNADAAVNVTVFGESGQLAAPGARGFVVNARSQRALALGPLVNEANPVTLQVTASSGRVAAVVRQRLFNGTASLGGDWLAAGQAPTTEATLAVVPVGAGARTLVIANPGDRTAQVTVDVLGPTSAYAPVGVEQVDVAPQTTKTFDLTGALAGRGGALRLRGTRPITASLEARTASDWALVPAESGVGSAVPLTLPLTADASAAVALANPGEKAASVTVVGKASDGQELVRSTVEVAPGASGIIQLPKSAGETLQVTSTVPDVRAGVVVTQDVGTVPGIGFLALEDAATSIPVGTTVRDPLVGA